MPHTNEIRTGKGGEQCMGDSLIGGPSDFACWCCGSTYPEDRIIRLGARPEAGVCLACTIVLRSTARRREPRAVKWPARIVLGMVDRARDTVMRHGWQRRMLIGTLLRRINRHLP